MSEPARNDRIRFGIFALAGILVLTVLAYGLKKEFWKDVH